MDIFHANCFYTECVEIKSNYFYPGNIGSMDIVMVSVYQIHIAFSLTDEPNMGYIVWWWGYITTGQ